MKNNNLIRFAQSLILLPAMTMSFSTTLPAKDTASNVLVPKVNTSTMTFRSFALNQADKEALAAQKAEEARKVKADAIDAYFAERDMPLEGTGMKMVQAAEDNDLDWRLLPAIAVRESTGGKQDCIKVNNNPFGWGSCKIGFKTLDSAIETVARNLGGNNPKTASHYDNKTTEQILKAYNPPSIVPKYVSQVISIMNAIGDADVPTTSVSTT